MPDLPTGPGKKILEQIRRTQQNHLAPEAVDSPHQQYLSFSLNEEWYALSVYYRVMNLRGEVLSVIDLKRFLGLPQDKAVSDPAIIVVEQGGVRTGLLVDSIGDLVGLAQENISEEPVLAGKSQPSFFEGAARWREVLLSIIRLEKLLCSEGMYSSPE